MRSQVLILWEDEALFAKQVYTDAEPYSSQWAIQNDHKVLPLLQGRAAARSEAAHSHQIDLGLLAKRQRRKGMAVLMDQERDYNHNSPYHCFNDRSFIQCTQNWSVNNADQRY